MGTIQNTSKAKDFEFKNIINNWAGYVSSVDKTNIKENYLVQGSLNVYKKLSGTLANRFGLKRLGVANSTYSAISSEYVWYTSWGATYTMVVSNYNLYVVKDNVWYSLLSGLSKTRYVFDKWWDNTEKKDRVLLVKGDADLQHWSGGMAIINGLTSVVTAINTTPTAGGSNYVPGDILTITLGTTDATVTVTSVTTSGITTGIVNGITLTTGGSGYTTGAGKLTTGGAGTGCTVEITTVSSPTANTLTLQDVSKSWIQYGFASNTVAEKKIIISGTEYTYTGGETTNILTGVTPSPIGIADGTMAIQKVITESNKPSSTFKNDMIKVIGNQAYIASYSGRQVFVSQDIDFKNFTVPSPQIAGSPALLTMDGNIKGISVRQGNAHIGFGAGGWAVISFSLTSNNNVLVRSTKVDIKPTALLQAPLAHEFIDTVGDNIIYLGQDNQVHSFGDFNNLFVAGYPSISQEIATELSSEVFTNGALRSIGEFIYITAPISGRVYLYQVRSSVNSDGTINAERLWHAPFVWSATRVDQIDGVVVAFSNSNPQIYQCWDTNQWYDDSPSDEHLPYTCSLALGYRGESRRQGLWSGDKYYTEGYIAGGTALSLQLNYNYQGYTNVLNLVVNRTDRPAYLFQQNLSSLGDTSLGEQTLGNGGITDLTNNNPLAKFKNINSITITNIFEWQPVYYSDTTDARWEVLAVGDNFKEEKEQDAAFIINKQR